MNKSIFGSVSGPIATAVNEAGGKAYALSDKEALAQLAVTGCFNDTFYATAEDLTAKIIALLDKVHPKFVAQVAVYARQHGNMKDMPAVMCAYLFSKRSEFFEATFDAVIDNGKMLRNFCQAIRSGMFGRKSFGSLGKKKIQNWLLNRRNLLNDSVGNDPSIADIIKMVHPEPKNKAQEALFGYLIGNKEIAVDLLPPDIQEYEAFKAGTSNVIPNVRHELLTNLNLGQAGWVEIARGASWTATRMNLNTFLRHGVFNEKGMVELIARRLEDKAEIAKSKCFPYQLMIAYIHTKDDANMPVAIKIALQRAMEFATENIPNYGCKVLVFPDVSGSMKGAAVTGTRKGATTAARCVDVAALVAASVLRKNNASVYPFDTRVFLDFVNPMDSIMTNADKLAKIGGGGTNCAAPMQYVNEQKMNADLVIYVSDNESWINSKGRNFSNKQREATETMEQWRLFKKRNPKAKLVCIDLQPYDTVQALNDKDILNIGGFSDAIFDVINNFVQGDGTAWVKLIEEIKI